MFAVGYIPNSGIEQFHDFWICLSIFNKSTQLQKNRKQKLKEREGTYLAAAHQPAHLAAQRCASPC